LSISYKQLIIPWQYVLLEDAYWKPYLLKDLNKFIKDSSTPYIRGLLSILKICSIILLFISKKYSFGIAFFLLINAVFDIVVFTFILINYIKSFEIGVVLLTVIVKNL